MWYRIRSVIDEVVIDTTVPPHIFQANSDMEAETRAREVWEQHCKDADYPPGEVRGAVRLAGPWLDADCTAPGPNCGEWQLGCTHEVPAQQGMAPLEDVLEDVVTRVGIVGFIILATAPGWWPIVRAIVA